MQRNRIAHYREGSSDKIYIVSVKENVNGKQFEVIAKWGRRGSSNVQVQVKGTFSSESAARASMNQLMSEKMAKGYEDIESSTYGGVVTVDSVEKHLEPEKGGFPRATKPSKAKDETAIPDFDAQEAAKNSSLQPGPLKGKKFMVKCISNVGIEERLDEGAEYQAEPHRDDEMIFVTDKNGVRDEFFADRFVKV